MDVQPTSDQSVTKLELMCSGCAGQRVFLQCKCYTTRLLYRIHLALRSIGGATRQRVLWPTYPIMECWLSMKTKWLDWLTHFRSVDGLPECQFMSSMDIRALLYDVAFSTTFGYKWRLRPKKGRFRACELETVPAKWTSPNKPDAHGKSEIVISWHWSWWKVWIRYWSASKIRRGSLLFTLHGWCFRRRQSYSGTFGSGSFNSDTLGSLKSSQNKTALANSCCTCHTYRLWSHPRPRLFVRDANPNLNGC